MLDWREDRALDKATDETFEQLTATGTVVVAFYMSMNSGYRAIQYKQPSLIEPGLWRKPRKYRRSDDIRRALKRATWEQSRKIKVVFVEYEQCKATCHRLGVIGFPEFWILKAGVRIAEKHGMFAGGHRDSYALAREDFRKWLTQHLSSS